MAAVSFQESTNEMWILMQLDMLQEENDNLVDKVIKYISLSNMFSLYI